MEVYFISFIIIGLAFLGMAAGVLMGRSGIKGSCGGLSATKGLDTGCPVCGTSRESGDKNARLQSSAKCS